MFRKIKLNPGLNQIASQTLNQTHFALSNLIRFYGGLIQKLGGWVRVTSSTFSGACYGLHGWSDLTAKNYLAAGTTTNLYVYSYDTGALSTLTLGAAPAYVPVVTNPAPEFSTVGGSSTVTITDPFYPPIVGQVITINVQVSAGEILLYGNYTVLSATSGSYTIAASGPAFFSAPTGNVALFSISMGSSTVQVILINHGLITGGTFTVPASAATTAGGLTISGSYVVTVTTQSNFTITASSVATSTTSAYENAGNTQISYGAPPSSGSALPVALPQWSLDNWGQDLIASPTNGPIYFWSPPTIGTANWVSYYAPKYNAAVFVMSQIQVIVSIGAEILGRQQPLLVRWCDVGDFTDWTASATNQAGSFQIPTGTRLVAGLAVGLGALLWTDVDLWSQTYEGFPLVFGFNRIAADCGAISMRCIGLIGTMVMWPSLAGFFNYSIGGGVTPMECPVWDYFINNVDTANFQKIHCATNAQFHEFAWHFPVSGSSPLIANGAFAYVKFNYIENAWDVGSSAQYQRSAWGAQSSVANPVGADLSGLLQTHEVGHDADGQAMSWSWQTGYFDIAEGEDYAFADFMIPDSVTTGSPTINYTVLVTNYPGLAPKVYGPYAATPSTQFIPFRARGRQMAIAAAGNDLGTFNRLGALRIRYAKDGRN